jgi:phosphoglycolate phosphatase-like HAD superfamily hydrolase
MLGMTNIFDIVVSAKDIGAIKPSPEGLMLIINNFGTKPRRTVYIGDMVDDIIAADLARVSSCGVACGFDSEHTLRSSNPNYLFKDMEHIFRVMSGAKARKKARN